MKAIKEGEEKNREGQILFGNLSIIRNFELL